MEALNLKTELKNLIESEQDSSILLAIKMLLQKAALNPVLNKKLISRALKAEEDIKHGRVYTREEVIARTKHIFEN